MGGVLYGILFRCSDTTSNFNLKDDLLHSFTKHMCKTTDQVTHPLGFLRLSLIMIFNDIPYYERSMHMQIASIYSNTINGLSAVMGSLEHFTTMPYAEFDSVTGSVEV